MCFIFTGHRLLCSHYSRWPAARLCAVRRTGPFLRTGASRRTGAQVQAGSDADAIYHLNRTRLPVISTES